MSRIGAGSLAFTAGNRDDVHPRTLLELVTETEGADARKTLAEDAIAKFVGINGGIGRDVHRTALGRRLALRRQMDGSITSARLAVAAGSPLAIGLGNEASSLELGLTLHRTIGVPYLPASALRGVARAFAGRDGKDANELFGTGSREGAVRFLDALPEVESRVAAEVMTPHFTEWYTNSEAPGEWFSPVPVKFLVVRSGSFVVDAITLASDGTEQRKRALTLLVEGLRWFGVGGKTSSGFGVLEREDAS